MVWVFFFGSSTITSLSLKPFSHEGSTLVFFHHRLSAPAFLSPPTVDYFPFGWQQRNQEQTFLSFVNYPVQGPSSDSSSLSSRDHVSISHVNLSDTSLSFPAKSCRNTSQQTQNAPLNNCRDALPSPVACADAPSQTENNGLRPPTCRS